MNMTMDTLIKIGDKVKKKSGKPLKSTLKTGVVIGFEINSYTKKMGAVMRDGSTVDLQQLEKVEDGSSQT